jgi:hypothetical protein
MILIIPFIIKAHLGTNKVCLRSPFFHALAVFSCALTWGWKLPGGTLRRAVAQ